MMWGDTMRLTHYQHCAVLHRYVLVCAIALFYGGHVLAGTLAAPRQEDVPKALVSEFYEWYLKELAADQPPFFLDTPKLHSYISSPLVRELNRQRASPHGMGNDYFMQAMDYVDDWVTNIRIEQARIIGKDAVVVVVLGAAEETSRRLVVTLMIDHAKWKIRYVRPQTSVGDTGKLAPPGDVVSEFYRWYLKEFVRSEPCACEREVLSGFVAKELDRELQRYASIEGGLGYDYFLNAQDYLDDWLTNIKIETARSDAKSAVVVVALGATERTVKRLEVSLVIEQNRWKIRKIRLL